MGIALTSGRHYGKPRISLLRQTAMFGVLNLNKPPGPTSRNVVNIVQRLAQPYKVGHAGTLDPLAEGVLLTCVGPATRLVEYAQRLPKFYRATFLLGQRSDTEDVEGDVDQLPEAPQPTRAQLERLLPQFQGVIEQVPPAFSALKVKGRRAYALARAGRDVELSPREVTIHLLRIVAYDYPRLELDITCGSGTYIRSLGRDIARAAGTEAVMAALVRTAIGPFTVEQSVAPEALSAENITNYLLPAITLLDDLPRVTLNTEEIAAITYGRLIDNRFGLSANELAAIDEQTQLLAILERQADNQLRPAKNFVGQ